MKTIMMNEDNPMAEKCFEVSLPEEVLAGFGWEEAEVPGKLREALVMELLRRDDIAEAQAAELLQLDRWDLLETMRRYQVSAIRMSPEELKRELTQEIHLD
jgi:transcriptional regulator with GAF, ATPase, and Fis domain